MGEGAAASKALCAGASPRLHNSIEFQLSAHLVVCPLAHANSILIGANLYMQAVPTCDSVINCFNYPLGAQRKIEWPVELQILQIEPSNWHFCGRSASDALWCLV
jgi:hypothetical protein